MLEEFVCLCVCMCVCKDREVFFTHKHTFALQSVHKIMVERREMEKTEE